MNVFHENKLDRIDRFKVDCQGSEYEILYAASPDTLACIQTIIVECEDFETPTDRSIVGTRRYLNNLGFSTKTRANLITSSTVCTKAWMSGRPS